MLKILSIKKSVFVLSLFLTTLAGCSSVRLISDYDEITDKAVVSLQQKVSGFFVKLKSDIADAPGSAKYSNYKTFYQEAKVDLNTLKIRADAIDKNEITQKMIAELTSMIDKTETLHKLGFSSVDQVTPLEQPFNSTFTAIIKLQMALKRGEKK